MAQDGREKTALNAQLIALLSDPQTYHERTQRVEVIETHISQVFLTDDYVYKLKKPVTYDFLDYGTVAKRKEACDAEVRLNRRLAPHVYLAVVPIVDRGGGHLSLGGDGDPVDYVVKMRRLAESRSLEHLIKSNHLTNGMVNRIGFYLAKFYEGLPSVNIAPEEYRRRIGEHVESNWSTLKKSELALAACKIDRIHSGQLTYLKLMPEIFDQRVADGRVVEAHGDLRPDHIYLNPSPIVIDCIEFNREFRELDALDELGFLAVECEFLLVPSVGAQILDHYKNMLEDDPPSGLLAFYMSYRACVRAKVHMLRSQQLTGISHEDAESVSLRYLGMADRMVHEFSPPIMVTVRGLSGTGKSTVAEGLSRKFGWELLSTDSIRRQMFGEPRRPVDYGHERYREEERRKVYDEIFRRAAALLQEQRSVVLDGTFLTSESRLIALSLARKLNAIPFLIECQCPDHIARSRIQRRMVASESMSDAQPGFLIFQREQEEADPSGFPRCHVDTDRDPTQVLTEACAQIKSSISTGPFRRPPFAEHVSSKIIE